MNSEWKPIETAPKDGSWIICMREGWDMPEINIWKTNHRIVRAHKKEQSLELNASYFGDPHESDDYTNAHKDDNEDKPTHWLPANWRNTK